MSEEIAVATAQDFIDVNGERPKMTFEGFSVRRDGRAVGIGGVYKQDGRNVVFSANVSASKRAIVRCARKVMQLAISKGTDLYAVRDQCLESSDRFLRHLGFEPVGMSDTNEVYKWKC